MHLPQVLVVGCPGNQLVPQLVKLESEVQTLIADPRAPFLFAVFGAPSGYRVDDVAHALHYPGRADKVAHALHDPRPEFALDIRLERVDMRGLARSFERPVELRPEGDSLAVGGGGVLETAVRGFEVHELRVCAIFDPPADPLQLRFVMRLVGSQLLNPERMIAEVAFGVVVVEEQEPLRVELVLGDISLEAKKFLDRVHSIQRQCEMERLLDGFFLLQRLEMRLFEDDLEH
mmetsp:Transcript_29452/g.67578  ORF Transcript_29452/g.67578 Transcript_29452/m.67578 type:complete len:232 (-) Transcript_29452:912-1607(-)